MKKFLEKFLSADKVAEIEKAYKEKNNDKDLPVYVGKERLDEEIGKKKEFETKVTDLEKQLKDANEGKQKAIDDAVKTAKDDAAKHEKEALDAQKKGFDITEAIYNAKGKNVTAIKALIDPTKVVADEIERIKKSDPYLFETAGQQVPPGTGKKGEGGGGGEDAEKEAMRKAVGML